MEPFDYGKWGVIYDKWTKTGLMDDESALMAVRWFPNKLDWITQYAEKEPWSCYAALTRDLSMINWIWAKVQMGADATLQLWPRTGLQVFGGVSNSLDSWVRKLHDAIARVAVALKSIFRHVSGFSIGIGGFPLGFSASISFSL